MVLHEREMKEKPLNCVSDPQEMELNSRNDVFVQQLATLED
jgi:hypothetical protein